MGERGYSLEAFIVTSFVLYVELWQLGSSSVLFFWQIVPASRSILRKQNQKAGGEYPMFLSLLMFVCGSGFISVASLSSQISGTRLFRAYGSSSIHHVINSEFSVTTWGVSLGWERKAFVLSLLMLCFWDIATPLLYRPWSLRVCRLNVIESVTGKVCSFC